MNHIFTKSFSFLSIFLTLVLFYSCNKKEGCTEPTADNFDPSAEIENNTCINARDKFVGVYLAFDNCAFVQKNFVAEIRKSNLNLAEILIYNFHNLNATPVRAQVNGPNLTIPSQSIGGGRRIEGSGSILGNVIQLNFITKIGTGPNTPQNFDVCNTTYTR